MNIAEINTVNYGSTGKIMLQIADESRKRDHTVRTYSKTWKHSTNTDNDHYFLGTLLSNVIHRALAPITTLERCCSYYSTLKLVNELKKLRPDIIHLHNLHGWYLNLPMLFRYIKKNHITVVWTFHDCWAFTGHCPHFTMVKCDKWKSGCHDCPQYREYPQSLLDNSKKMYKLKKKWFMGVENLTIVTPSQWLADLVKQSFLKDYPVKVINNGIDLSIFKPTNGNFRESYGIPNDKYIILGVAFGWGKRKGLDVFIELSKRLGDKYQVVLVGTDEKIDKVLPDNIISIHRTHDQKELAEIYTEADLFVNPTREDNFPTVNIESIACGTPVMTFKTGGSPEMLDETCGSVVECGDIDAMEAGIIRICKDKPYSEEACIKRAQEFDKNSKFQEYIDLYKEMEKSND